MFSSRVPGVLNLNRLSSAVAAHRAAGRAVVDLTVTNPTAVGILYGEAILAPLADPRGCRYQPEPFGLITARTAVASDYRRRGISVAEDRIVLTSSTSEAYSLLFKLLCAPSRDEVLVPAPSYPLFDHLTQLDGVSSRQYGLEYHGRWELDVDSVDRAWTERTRAVLAVSPNNPTGSMLSAGEFGKLTSRCAERDAALIVDEVFTDYSFAAAKGDGRPAASNRDCLSFHLGGLSKSAGLPQVKLGWMRVDGPDQLVAGALDRLELICDTYLSVSTPVQVAAPALIESGAEIRRQIRERIQTNYAALEAAVAANPSVELLAAEGGWSAVIRVPSRWTEEELVIALLRERDVLVHPGFFFDFAHEAFLVLSLLPDPAVFADGTNRVMEHVGG